MNRIVIYATRVAQSNPRQRPWRAWVDGGGFSAEGPTRRAAVGELLATLAEYPDLVGGPAGPDELLDLLASERDRVEPEHQAVTAEGGGL